MKNSLKCKVSPLWFDSNRNSTAQSASMGMELSSVGFVSVTQADTVATVNVTRQKSQVKNLLGNVAWSEYFILLGS